MSRFIGFVFAACLIAIWTSTSVPAASPDWPKSLTLGTASPGGVYYVYGEALAEILTEKLGITVNPSPNQGSVHNVRLVDSGGVQVGLTTMGVGLEGWTGTGDWTKGQKFRQMRALFPMYDTPFQPMVLRRSGITTIAQLDKKRLGVGPRGGTSGTYVPAILKVLGISGEIGNGAQDLVAADLLSGRYDAYLAMLGAPTPAIQKVEESEPVTFVSLLPNRLKPSAKRCRSSAHQRSWPELTTLWRTIMLHSECTILRSDEPIFRTIWCINSSKQSSRTNRAS
jgi:TRAP transporter TAXI family solute receptor